MADNVFINGRAAIHAGSAGKSIAFPDVCLCPPPPPSGPIPTPLPNTAQAMDLQGGAATVTIEGNPVAHAKSFIAKSTGNEVATSTGGGVITHVVQGKAYFQTFSMDVFIESQPAVRHMDSGHPQPHGHDARQHAARAVDVRRCWRAGAGAEGGGEARKGGQGLHHPGTQGRATARSQV